MPEPRLLSELHEGVLTLTLNRPDKLNAIDHALASGLLHALEAASTDPAVRALHLRGMGRAFCAGRDVSAAPTEDDLRLVQGVATALVRNAKPVVAEVHGWTVGAGLEWMLCADIVVAAENTRFKLPEASLGVFVTGGLTVTLPAVAGLARAKAIALLGEEFGARQALEWGLVWKLVDDAERGEASRRTARALAALEPRVVAQFKRVFNLLGLEAFDRAVIEESATQRQLAQG